MEARRCPEPRGRVHRIRRAPWYYTADCHRLRYAMSIRLTASARDRMQAFLAQTPAAAAGRFGVKRTGCSGFAYTVDLAEQVRDDDRVFDLDGVRVVVDAPSLPLVEGTVIDFRRDGLNASFAFHNPQATGACGCG